MLNVIRQFVKEEEGASAAEYALLLALIALVLVAAVLGCGATNIGSAINSAANVLVPPAS